jgi:hypothetical protein
VNKKPVTRLLSFIQLSFLISIGYFMGLIYFGVGASEQQDFSRTETLYTLMVLAGPVWYVTLGMIAHRLGRRWLVWVGLAFILPFASLIIVPLMLHHIKVASQSVTESTVSVQ